MKPVSGSTTSATSRPLLPNIFAVEAFLADARCRAFDWISPDHIDPLPVVVLVRELGLLGMRRVHLKGSALNVSRVHLPPVVHVDDDLRVDPFQRRRATHLGRVLACQT